MLNQLFTEISSVQQETVVGGFTVNFGTTSFTGIQQGTSTTTTSLPDGGSSTESTTANVQINTVGITGNGFDLPETFQFANFPFF